LPLIWVNGVAGPPHKKSFWSDLVIISHIYFRFAGGQSKAVCFDNIVKERIGQANLRWLNANHCF
jgi:hypothetical protein